MQQLADLAGIPTRTTVWRWERGMEINLSAAVAIAAALDVALDELTQEATGE